MISIKKGDLENSNKFMQVLEEFIEKEMNNISQKYNIYFEFDELRDFLMCACRSNDFDVIVTAGKKIYLDEEKLLSWIYNKLIPNTVIIRIDDRDIVKLLLFCIEFTYQMFSGGTKATISAKGFRERRRTFESILVDQFIGKLGEVMVKKFIERDFPGVRVDLDWEISRNMDRYRNDIINAKKKINIKSSPSLGGIWSEADMGYMIMELW